MIKENIKLALYGAGCTKNYAEKQSETLMQIVKQIRIDAKKEVFEDIDNLHKWEGDAEKRKSYKEYIKIKIRHLNNKFEVDK